MSECKCRLCLLELDPQVEAMKRNNGEMACAGYAAGFVESQYLSESVICSLCDRHLTLVAFYTAAVVRLGAKLSEGVPVNVAAAETESELGVKAPTGKDLS